MATTSTRVTKSGDFNVSFYIHFLEYDFLRYILLKKQNILNKKIFTKKPCLCNNCIVGKNFENILWPQPVLN